VTDRSQAISLVQAAVKSGRIVQADADMRLDQIKSASSQQDVDLVVRDLQTPGPGVTAAMAGTTVTPTSAGTPPASGQPWPLVNYGPGQGQAAADVAQAVNKGGKAIGGIIVLVVLISVIVPIVGVVIGLVSARDTFKDLDFASPVDETTYLPGQAPGENGVNVHTIDGFNEFVAEVKAETGSTTVFDAVLYPRYAVASIPESPTGKRYTSWYWDGHSLTQNDFKSTANDPRIDLASVDPSVMITLLEEVRGRIEKPTSWYVSIDSIAATGTGMQLAVYASNEYGEGAYILADLEGNVTYESEY
jgi:uncharacterized protein DUF1707